MFSSNQLKEAIEHHPFTNLTKIEHYEGVDYFYFTLETEIPQHPVYDLNKIEPLLIISRSTKHVPEVYSLRDDFPNTPHQYLTEDSQYNRLCLYEQSEAEIRQYLTPQNFITRITIGFSRAGKGELHLRSQRMEPFVLSAGKLVFTEDLAQENEALDLYAVSKLSSDHGAPFYAYPLQNFRAGGTGSLKYVAIIIKLPPTDGTIISRYPEDLKQLSSLLSRHEVDLESILADRTTKIIKQGKRALLAKKWMLIFDIPKKETGETEKVAFLIEDVNIESIGRAIGVLKKPIGGEVLLSHDKKMLEEGLGKPIALDPISSLSRQNAQRLSGVRDSMEGKNEQILSIGAGALGSQAVLNLAKQGVAPWKIVDHDNLLPHNFSRHGLGIQYLGRNKAKALSEEINGLLGSNSEAEPYPNNILYQSPEQVEKVLEGVSVILDFAVSRAVSLHISRLRSTAPRMSAFITRRGEYLIVLAEDAKRTFRLNDLDMQLASSCAMEEELREVLALPEDTNEVRYGGSCSDISTVIAQDDIAISAGIVSKEVKRWLINRTAFIKIFRIDNDNFEVKKREVVPHSAHTYKANNWEIRVSQLAIEKMGSHRKDRLPNETGGVLLGTYDVLNKTLYVADVLPSPPDSTEWPNLYIRGVKGLNKKLKVIGKRSGNNISYVGEWHTHVGSPSPSDMDLEAKNTLSEQMQVEGLPTLILIQGNQDYPRVLFQVN